MTIARASKQVHYDSGPNMTPLVDVVMVILIFLMLAGSFGGSAHFLASRLPIVANGPGDTPFDPARDVVEPLEIRVDPSPHGDGFVARAGDLRVDGDADGLARQLDAKRRAFLAAGTPADKIRVVIRPGRSVKYRHLASVYEAALRAKFEKVAFATSH